MRYTNDRWHWRGIATVALMGMATAAMGHGQAKTEPADGAALSEPPKTIEVAFDAPTRVTNLELVGPDGSVDLASSVSTESTKRIEIEPAESLAPGQYTVQWRALGSDGHPFGGSASFTVKE